MTGGRVPGTKPGRGAGRRDRRSHDQPTEAPLVGTSVLIRALRAIAEHPRPVVAAIGGEATGADALLAGAADLRVMSHGTIGPGRPIPARGLRP